MSTEPGGTASVTDPRAAVQPAPDLLAERTAAAERADVEEDRRRQQDLDDAELGGEA
jgi:hypothetical protein